MKDSSVQFPPVALFTYARPEHTRRTLEGLRRNEVPRIYAFQDGPKSSNDQPLVDEVTALLHTVDWTEIEIIKRESNFGLGTSIRSGVTEVLEKHPTVVVVEDDIVLRPGAYKFVSEALVRFHDDSRVLTISMWSNPALSRGTGRNGFFSKRFTCWGWATTRQGWELFQGKIGDLYESCLEAGIDPLCWGNDIEHQVREAETKDIWAVGFTLVHFLQGRFSYIPAQTLTVNIGLDGSGENCPVGENKTAESLIEQPVPFPSEWPEVELSPKTARRFREYYSYPRLTPFQKFRIWGGALRRKYFRYRH